MEKKRSLSATGTRPVAYENNFFKQESEDEAKYADPPDAVLHPLKKHRR